MKRLRVQSAVSTKNPSGCKFKKCTGPWLNHLNFIVVWQDVGRVFVNNKDVNDNDSDLCPD